MSDNPSNLQGLIDIAVHYGKRYRITYGPSKTKITISGPEIDRNFYADTKPWIMEGDRIPVTTDNDHLGQIVSGEKQIEKNIDNRIQKGRSAMFKLMGPTFAPNCILSPILKLHCYRTFVCPVLTSGLSSFVLRTNSLRSIIAFERKTLRSILQLSQSSPIPAIHFLTGELPMEGKLHRDAFSLLFYSIWSNTNTKIYEIVRYLLQYASDNSRTWTIYLRQLSKL